MLKFKQILHRWLPALLVMLGIFYASSQPSENLPDLGWADRFFKKSGHVIGYALLALSYWRGFGWAEKKRAPAWLLSVFYAMTDEFHQSFIDGRHPSLWDVVIFDNLGALLALWLAGAFLKQKRTDEST